MNEEQQLKLQALLDGELPEAEAREVSAWMAADAEATALARELRNTRQAFKSSELRVTLPESREFYWSKIRREIERLEPAEERRSAPSLLARIRRVLVPLGAVTAVIAAGLVAGVQSGLLRSAGTGVETQMTVADSGAFTYQDFANGTTLVWVTYPAER